MAIQMTRKEYEEKYGVKPVVSTSTLDIKPAPMRMTRAEYQSLYGDVQTPEPGLGGKLLNRATDAMGAPFRPQAFPGQAHVNVLGDVGGAVGDVFSAAISPIFDKVVDKVSNNSIVQKVAGWNPMSKGLDEVNSDIQYVGEQYKDFKSENPNTARTLEDLTNALNLLPGTKAKVPSGLKNKLDVRITDKRAKEIFDIENNYQKTRTANEYSSDAGASSRARIAETDVLVNAVDADGTIRTKTPGGAVDQYKAQTIDGVEDIVRRGLVEAKETAPFADVKKYLLTEIGRSGLEGGDLITALKGVERELQGLQVRTRGSSIIDLPVIHDAKISTTNNINYMTPPETKTYRKAVARAYKKFVEDKSTKFKVEPVNKELSKYYQDIERLENLDGRKVKGGRLGKYFAQTTGTVLGMGGGAVAGPGGSLVGGAVGGEVARALQGKMMSSTFGRATGKTAPKSAILERAKLSIPDKKVVASRGVPKTKEIVKLEKDIAKNVEQQKKAVARGDFTLVQALKDIYLVLVDQLKTLIKEVKESAKNPGLGMSIKKSVTPESVAKGADREDISNLAQLLDDPTLAQTDPDMRRMLGDMGLGKATQNELERFARDVIDESEGFGGREVMRSGQSAGTSGGFDGGLATEAKKYKSAEEFVKAQTNAYHGTPNKEFAEFKFDANSNTQNETRGLGVWVTPQEGAAVQFKDKFIEGFMGMGGGTKDVGGTVMPVHLKLKNPKVYTSTKGMDSILDKIKKIEEERPSLTRLHFTEDVNERQAIIQARKNADAEIDKLKREYRRDAFENFMDDRDHFATYIQKGAKWEDRYIAEKVPETNKAFIEYLKAQGHDGILIKGTEYDAKGTGHEVIDQIVSFDPQNVLTRSQLTDIWKKANEKK